MKNIVFCLPRPCLRALLGSPGAVLGRLGGPGLSGGPLGSLWGPSWGSPGRLWGLSWAVWGPSGAVLVLSWGPRGPSWGPLWGHWGCPGADVAVPGALLEAFGALLGAKMPDHGES